MSDTYFSIHTLIEYYKNCKRVAKAHRRVAYGPHPASLKKLDYTVMSLSPQPRSCEHGSKIKALHCKSYPSHVERDKRKQRVRRPARYSQQRSVCVVSLQGVHIGTSVNDSFLVTQLSNQQLRFGASTVSLVSRHKVFDGT
jgi:hypothetical protein